MTVNADRFPGLDWPACRAEVEREVEARRRTYPDRVAGGRMTRRDADWQVDIFVAIAADVGRMAHIGPDRPPASHDFGWNDRRQALIRELELRDHLYPDRIASGRLTQGRADRQRQALRAILFRYDEGFDWRPANGVLPLTAQQMLDGVAPTPEQAASEAEVRAIWEWPHGLFWRRWPREPGDAADPAKADQKQPAML